MEEQTSNLGDLDRPTFGSLFAGVGGFDLGFEAAGWEPRWQVEWDSRCRGVLARHWPNVARYGDVCDVHRPEPVDCITYGFPCQDLSVAGRRAGLDGDRSNLFFEAVRIIREMRDATGGRYPTFAVAENVEGLLNADGGAAMGRCLDALAEIGAVGIEWAMLDAQHFGVPQRRKRVFIVAWFDPRVGGGEEVFPVRESCGRDSEKGGKAGQDIAGSVAACLNSSGNDGGFRTEPGENLIPVGHPDPAYALTSREGKGASQRDGQSTLVAHIDPFVKVRRLTPRECERLMGWPDDHTRWAADGREIADTNRYRMCGNGVAAPVAEWVARRLAATGFRDAG